MTGAGASCLGFFPRTTAFARSGCAENTVIQGCFGWPVAPRPWAFWPQAAVLWLPALRGLRMRHTEMAGIEAWLPNFHVGDRHERVIDIAPERALETALSTPVAPDRLVRLLLRARGLAAVDESIETFFQSNGFVMLERTPMTFVVGVAVTVSRNRNQARDPERWRNWSSPGIKIAADLRVEPVGKGQSRVVTETRVAALDRRSLWIFRLYWVVVRPF